MNPRFHRRLAAAALLSSGLTLLGQSATASAGVATPNRFWRVCTDVTAQYKLDDTSPLGGPDVFVTVAGGTCSAPKMGSPDPMLITELSSLQVSSVATTPSYLRVAYSVAGRWIKAASDTGDWTTDVHFRHITVVQERPRPAVS